METQQDWAFTICPKRTIGSEIIQAIELFKELFREGNFCQIEFSMGKYNNSQSICPKLFTSLLCNEICSVAKFLKTKKKTDLFSFWRQCLRMEAYMNATSSNYMGGHIYQEGKAMDHTATPFQQHHFPRKCTSMNDAFRPSPSVS